MERKGALSSSAATKPTSHWLSNRSDGQGGGTIVLMPGQGKFSVAGGKRKLQQQKSRSQPVTSKKRSIDRAPASQPERKSILQRSSSGPAIDLVSDEEPGFSAASQPNTTAPLLQKKTMAEFNAEIAHMCSFEQKQVLKYVADGHNVCFTGSAGTGKSFLIQKLCERFSLLGQKKFEDFFVTASTGIAAVPLGGSTVHSFSSIGRGEKGTKLLVHQIRRSQKSMDRWKKASVLIIDEVSMVKLPKFILQRTDFEQLSTDIFDKIDQIGRRIRAKEAPFGGLQIILSGDFFQLPPVPVSALHQSGRCKLT